MAFHVPTDSWKRRIARVSACLGAAAALHGCATESGSGFHLPDGDPERGREAFVALGCDSCHTVAGLERPLAGGTMVLGGDTARVRIYGDLVTSLVNPSHYVPRSYAGERGAPRRESPMAAAGLNEIMTVQQLVDLVALLQSAYNVVPPPIRTSTAGAPPHAEETPIGNVPRP